MYIKHNLIIQQLDIKKKSIENFIFSVDATLYCKLCKKKFEDEIALEKHTATHKENKNNVQNYDNTGKLPI